MVLNIFNPPPLNPISLPNPGSLILCSQTLCSPIPIFPFSLHPPTSWTCSCWRRHDLHVANQVVSTPSSFHSPINNALLATQPSPPWFSPPYWSPDSAAQPAVCSWLLLIFPHLPHLYALKCPEVMYSVSTSSKHLIVWSPSTQKAVGAPNMFTKIHQSKFWWREVEGDMKIECGVATGEQEPTVAASLSTLSSITYGGNNTAEN